MWLQHTSRRAKENPLMNRSRAIESVQAYAANRRAALIAAGDTDRDQATKSLIRLLGTISAALWMRVPLVLDEIESMWREALEYSPAYERPLREIAHLRTLLDAALATENAATLDVELIDLTADGSEQARIAQLTLAR
ncbi:hypothetical protein Br6_04853 [Rhodococcus sp. Br-6]|nr:hypothetical protein Br6_04853 [Rhodococcus sp. Br-6]